MELTDLCPICASPNPEELATAPLFGPPAGRVMRCRACRYVFQDDAGRPAAMGHREHREQPAGARVGTLGDVALGQQLAMLESVVARGAVLDIGCGTGHFLDLARSRGWQVAGIECSAAAQQARALLSSTAVATVACEGHWPAGSFDAVTLWGASEFNQQPTHLLGLAAHYCRIDGILMLQTLYTGAAGRGGHPARWGAQHHAGQPSSPATLHRLLSRFGFRIERIERGTRVLADSRLHLPSSVQAPCHHRQHTVGTRLRSGRRLATPLYANQTIILTARYVP